MNRRQIFLNELEKIKMHHVQAELAVQDVLFKLRSIPQFCAIDDKMRKLNLELSKTNDDKTCKKLRADIAKLTQQREDFLLAHHYPSNILQPKYFCQKCNDTGYIDQDICHCLNIAVQKELLKQSGINTALNYTFDTYDQQIVNNNETLTKAYKIAKQYVSNFPKFKYPNMALIGNVGSGKTYMLECIANTLIRQGHYVVFCSAFDMNNLFIKSINQNDADLLEPIQKCDLLIIDDLGSEPVIQNITINQLLNIIEIRERNNLPYLFSSNLSLDELRDRYGERVSSRLFNKSKCLAIPFDGKDLRINKN